MPAEAGKSHSTSSFRPLTIVAEGSLWDRFNQRHLGLKLTRIAKQRDTQTRKETNSIHLQQNPMGQSFILEQLAIQIEHLRKVPEQAYNAACEVWKKQGEKKAPEFVQVMFNKVILPTIQGRTTGIWQEFQRYAAAGGLPEADATFRAGRLRLGKAVEEVCEDWRINAEEEMLELGYKEAGDTSKGTGRRTPQKKAPRRKERKGDSTLLRGKDAVTFRTAEQYLGISERQRQNLVRSGALVVVGGGHNSKITVESLKKYLLPKNQK